MRLSSVPLAWSLLVAGCIAFLGTAYGEHRSLGELAERSAIASHALRTQLMLRHVGSLLLDLETGQRGFLITGQAAFLEPYENSRQELDIAYRELKTQLRAAETPMPELARLDELIDARVKQAQHNVEQRWQQGEAALRDLSGYVAGKQLMDEVRAELTQLEAEQTLHIAQAEAQAQAVQARTALLSNTLPVVGVLLMAGAMLALLRERRRRDRAETALQEANSRLEATVARRTEALRSALARIQGFAAQLDQTVEAERVRLAREVHDQIGQIGTATKMLVLALRRKLLPDKEPMLDELLAMCDESIAIARQIAASLRPPLLDDLGLAAAVKHYAQALERQGSLQVSVELNDEERLGADQRNQLFRILQEAATNVLRHAQASTLQINGRANGTHYGMEVIDNGIGPGSVRADASGLRNMRERAALAGGRFEFGAAPGGGSRVGISLPLRQQQAQGETQP